VSTAADEPPEDAEPRKIGYGWGWTDGWDNRSPATNVPKEYQEAYDAGYELGQRERNEVPERAYHPDCDGIHADGECPMVVLPRDPWWIKLLSWRWRR
jgi:hypothetical protein